MSKIVTFVVKMTFNRKTSLTKIAQHPQNGDTGHIKLMTRPVYGPIIGFFQKPTPQPIGSPVSRALSLPQVIELHVLLFTGRIYLGEIG